MCNIIDNKVKNKKPKKARQLPNYTAISGTASPGICPNKVACINEGGAIIADNPQLSGDYWHY